MKLQVAIDRMTLSDAIKTVKQLTEVDVIEIGTSLCKEYGLECVRTIKKHISEETKILADIKTIDQGKYEFTKYFEAGADSLTVMGVSSIDTLDKCYEVSRVYKKEMMIDLLECSNKKIAQIEQYQEAIYCLHFSSDSKKEYSIKQVINDFNIDFPKIKRVAIAGGIDLKKLKELEESTVERAIVGSFVTKGGEPNERVKELREEMNSWT